MIEKLYVFGDSLQDNGNLYKKLQFPNSPYYSGRFSDGYVCCEYAKKIIEKKQKKKITFINKAIGGAMTYGVTPKEVLAKEAHCVVDQLDNFIKDGGKFSDNDVISLNGGGNNFLFVFNTEKPYLNLKPAFSVARDLTDIIEKMIENGAKKIVVWNVPNVTSSPAFNNKLPKMVLKLIKTFLHSRIKKENNKLSNNIDFINKNNKDVEINLFNAYDLHLDITKNAAKYNVKNTSDICVDSFGGCDADGNIQSNIKIIGNTKSYLYWDYVHPTTAVHKLLGEFLAKKIQD